MEDYQNEHISVPKYVDIESDLTMLRRFNHEILATARRKVAVRKQKSRSTEVNSFCSYRTSEGFRIGLHGLIRYFYHDKDWYDRQPESARVRNRNGMKVVRYPSEVWTAYPSGKIIRDVTIRKIGMDQLEWSFKDKHAAYYMVHFTMPDWWCPWLMKALHGKRFEIAPGVWLVCGDRSDPRNIEIEFDLNLTRHLPKCWQDSTNPDRRLKLLKNLIAKAIHRLGEIAAHVGKRLRDLKIFPSHVVGYLKPACDMKIMPNQHGVECGSKNLPVSYEHSKPVLVHNEPIAPLNQRFSYTKISPSATCCYNSPEDIEHTNVTTTTSTLPLSYRESTENEPIEIVLEEEDDDDCIDSTVCDTP